ncbi:MAG: 50S ribosomal protein L9 [Kiritimatiellia bacterium]
MSTEVFLMKSVPHLGDEGDVVTVADGYARNYLFAKKLAAPVTDATRRKLEKMREEREKLWKERLEEAQKKADALENVSLTIAVKVTEDEKLFGSVSAQDISDGLKQQGIELDKSQLILDDPIKELGVYDVRVKLHPEVEATVRAWVVEE